MKRRAKIVATIGPASSSPEKLQQLVSQGMDVARLNFSHGDHAQHGQAIADIRHIAEKQEYAIAIMQDLQGPKVRTGHMAEGESVNLENGQELILTTQPTETTASRVFVDFEDLPRTVSKGDRILLDDGKLELRVLATGKHEVRTEVVQGGALSAHKGVNLPTGKISPDPLTSKDLEDLDFGLKHHVDYVAISFVRSGSDIAALRQAIAERAEGPRLPAIIAKLERFDAIDQLEGILEASDGVMVARGDLGVELSPAKIPSLQKRIIQQANEQLRLVITATQMLESMVHSPRPTRAEASDVANAVFDGSDALMLSAETATGDYPVETVRTMAQIILEAEGHSAEWGFEPGEDLPPSGDDAVATTHAARALAHDRDVAAIAVFTRSGRTARLMSKARPQVPILAFTPEQETYRQMALLWGVVPHLVPKANTVEEMIQRVEQAGLGSALLEPGNQVVLVASFPIGAMGPPNFTLLQTVGEES